MTIDDAIEDRVDCRLRRCCIEFKILVVDGHGDVVVLTVWDDEVKEVREGESGRLNSGKKGPDEAGCYDPRSITASDHDQHLSFRNHRLRPLGCKQRTAFLKQSDESI